MVELHVYMLDTVLLVVRLEGQGKLLSVFFVEFLVNILKAIFIIQLKSSGPHSFVYTLLKWMDILLCAHHVYLH